MKKTAKSMIFAGSLLSAAGATAFEFPKKAANLEDERAKSPLICQYDAASHGIVVLNKADHALRASMGSVYAIEKTALMAHGVVYLKDHKTLDGPVKFTADFKDASCSYGHAGDTWGFGTTKAPMEKSLQQKGSSFNFSY